MQTRKTGIAMALAIALLFLAPLGAASESVIPYVNINQPKDGETVSGVTAIEFVAEGYNLHDPSLSISGEHVGVAFPLNCEIVVPEGSGNQVMYCQYEWNTKEFADQKVIINASVYEGEKVLNDKVGVYVSGERA